jgi:hypothetical protein
MSAMPNAAAGNYAARESLVDFGIDKRFGLAIVPAEAGKGRDTGR